MEVKIQSTIQGKNEDDICASNEGQYIDCSGFSLCNDSEFYFEKATFEICDIQSNNFDIKFYNGTIVEIFNLKNVLWINGTWEGKNYTRGDCIWENGKWIIGTWKGGLWKGGLWENGLWTYGEWETGIWENGVWENGIWIWGLWKSGVWKSGTWKNGLWKTGTWKSGLWKGGIWEDGIWEGGVWIDGTWKGGKWQKGFDKNFQFHNVPPNEW